MCECVYVVYECMCVHALSGVRLLLKGVASRPEPTHDSYGKVTPK